MSRVVLVSAKQLWQRAHVHRDVVVAEEANLLSTKKDVGLRDRMFRRPLQPPVLLQEVRAPPRQTI